MAVTETLAALAGAIAFRKKESRIEPYVRTLAMADIAHSEAMIQLVAATKELTQVATEKKEPDDAES